MDKTPLPVEPNQSQEQVQEADGDPGRENVRISPAPASEAPASQARASLELLYHVSRELASALDLRTLLQRVLYLATQNVGAISGSIVVLDDAGQPVESAFLLRGQAHDESTVELRLTFEHGLAGWVVRNRESALLDNTSQDERWLRRPDDSEERTGAKSAVATPILAREKLVGVLTLVHPQPGFFTSEHLDLVQAISDQAGIAILNARLYNESQRQARVMTAVAESAGVITASLDLDDVLQRILVQISHALRVESVSLALFDLQTQELEFRATTDKNSGSSIAGKRLPLGKGIAGWVAQEGRGVVVGDVRNDPRFCAEFDQAGDYVTRAVVCAPIRSRGQVIGVLEAINPLNQVFDPDALLVLTGIGSLAGTAIRHAQLFESLQSAHQRYRELFEDSIDPILLTDWQGNVTEANRGAELMTGLERDALRSLNVLDLHQMDRERLGPDFEKLASAETITYETQLHTLNGRDVPVQVYVRQVQIDGRSHLQWIFRDITERKNLDNLRYDLTAMVYHDLRSPLANVVSSLDVLASILPVETDASMKSLLNIAVRSTERIQRLTNSLLDINRLESGQPVGDRRPVAPQALITAALEAVAPMAVNKNLTVITHVDPDLPEVPVDADMIHRVLVNLLENAVKFTPQEGAIQIGASLQTPFVLFSVKDTGPGIPPAEHERIFDKFTRLENIAGARGLGLGLAFCRLAVLGHGGRIWVESQDGQGSTFCFYLPVDQETKPKEN